MRGIAPAGEGRHALVARPTQPAVPVQIAPETGVLIARAIPSRTPDPAPRPRLGVLGRHVDTYA